MKAEKESRDHQEMLMTRRRHEELARQQLLRAQVFRFSPLIWLHRLLTDIMCSKHQSRQLPLPNNNNSNNNNNRNSSNRSHNNRNHSNSRQVTGLLDQLHNLPNLFHKSVPNPRSLKSTSPSNNEYRLRWLLLLPRAYRRSRCFRSRPRKRARMLSRLSPSRRRKYMLNCKLRHRLKRKVRRRPPSVVYLLVRTSRHHTIPGQRRPRPASVPYNKLLLLGLLLLLRTLPLRAHSLLSPNRRCHPRRSPGTRCPAQQAALQRIIYQWYLLAHISRRNRWTRR